MSYDTEHVRNAGSTPDGIAGVPTFAQLVDNPDLAALYTELRQASSTTAPALVETMRVSKKTVYDYLHRLEQAGLATTVGEDNGTTVYAAEPFELTLTVGETTVTITPDLIEIVANSPDYPTIERVLADHGILTVALAYDLVVAHNNGEVTIRQLAQLTGLSPGTAYDLVDALYSVLDLGDDDPTPTTYTPADFDGTAEGRLAELADGERLAESVDEDGS